MSKRHVVMVLGPGRSGTSLLMQLLQAHGLKTSGNLIQGDITNPQGFFEDSDIVATHQAIAETLGIPATYPMSLNKGEMRKLEEHKNRLKEIVQNHLAEPHWGFKDPRASTLLPLWEEVFQELGVTPRYILCVRHPGSVVESMKRQYQSDDILAELIWFNRTVESIVGSAGNLFLVHYEDWFGDGAVALGEKLLDYVGLPREGFEQTRASLVKPTLNRCEVPYAIKNHAVERLYLALRQCPSGAAIAGQVLDEAVAGKNLISQFSRWIHFSLGKNRELTKTNQQQQLALQKLQEQVVHLEQKCQDLQEKATLAGRMGADLKNLTDKYASQALRLQDAHLEIERLRAHIHAMATPAKGEKVAVPRPPRTPARELTPSQRKWRKFFRTPGLFLKDWLAKRLPG